MRADFIKGISMSVKGFELFGCFFTTKKCLENPSSITVSVDVNVMCEVVVEELTKEEGGE